MFKLLNINSFKNIYPKKVNSIINIKNLYSQSVELNKKIEIVYKKNSNSNLFFKNSLENSNIKTIGIIGWGSQGQAQALNLRDTIDKLNLNINLVIGLRDNSNSKKKAEELGFRVSNIEDVLRKCDLNLMLISDNALCNNYKDYFSFLKPNSTLGLSHGFLLGHLKNIGEDFPKNNNIIMVAPKGMGITVRNQYLVGSGINSSYAVYNDIDDNAKNLALSWAYGIGSPQIYETTIEKEYISDIFGERAILLGGLHGTVEYLFDHFNELYTNNYSYNISVNYIVDELSKEISLNGLKSLYNNLCSNDKDIFENYYSKSYHICNMLFEEIYDEVKSGNEIRSVNLNSNRSISNISGSKMWKNNKYIKKNYEILNSKDKAMVYGLYVGGMMSQIDILIKNEHNYSEIVNESIIEAVDSLNPYMNNYGISNMIDNCSTTARLGARKWGPRLDYLFKQNINLSFNDFNDYDNYDNYDNYDCEYDNYDCEYDYYENHDNNNNNNDNDKKELIDKFLNHEIHDIYKTIRDI